MYIPLDVQRWLRSPRKDISQADNNVNRIGPVIIRHHVRAVAVKLEYFL